MSGLIAAFLEQHGLERVVDAGDAVRLQDSGPGDRPQGIQEDAVWVDLEQVTTRCAFSYASEGWHPYTATIVEYAGGGPREATDSILGRYLNSFSPSSAGEAILGPDSEPDALHDLPAYPLDFVKRVWELNAGSVEQLKKSHEGGPPTWGNPHYGPASPEWITAEYDRLISIYEAIRKSGYRPTEVADGYIHGYFLVRGTNFRFVALEGNHRLGALRALGIPQVAVLPWQPLPVVRESDLDKPNGRPGEYFARDVSQRLFDVLFESSGFEKANKLGLV